MALRLEPWSSIWPLSFLWCEMFSVFTAKKQVSSSSLPVVGVLNEVVSLNVPSGTWQVAGTLHSFVH